MSHEGRTMLGLQIWTPSCILLLWLPLASRFPNSLHLGFHAPAQFHNHSRFYCFWCSKFNPTLKLITVVNLINTNRKFSTYVSSPSEGVPGPASLALTWNQIQHLTRSKIRSSHGMRLRGRPWHRPFLPRVDHRRPFCAQRQRREYRDLAVLMRRRQLRNPKTQTPLLQRRRCAADRRRVGLVPAGLRHCHQRLSADHGAAKRAGGVDGPRDPLVRRRDSAVPEGDGELLGWLLVGPVEVRALLGKVATRGENPVAGEGEVLAGLVLSRGCEKQRDQSSAGQHNLQHGRINGGFDFDFDSILYALKSPSWFESWNFSLWVSLNLRNLEGKEKESSKGG